MPLKDQSCFNNLTFSSEFPFVKEIIKKANRTKKVYTFIIDISIESSDKLKFVLAEMKTLSQVDKVKRQSINY